VEDPVARLTEDGCETQHKQNARGSAGTWFDPSHIACWLPHPPVGTVAVRYWDTAASEGETACETAGVLLGRVPEGRFIVIDVAAGKWQPVDLDNATVPPRTPIAGGRERVLAQWLEEEGGGSGNSDVQSIFRKLAGIPAFAWKGTSDKDVRIRAFADQWQSRNVLRCLGEWNAAYLAQMKTIPWGKHHDQADASAGAFNRLVETPMPTGMVGLPNAGQERMANVSEDAFRY
jgi:predicted phage terminase large subunit-like protein